MPRFRITPVVECAELTAIRAVCDGCDPARPCDEHTRRASLWLVTAGAFEVRDRDGAHVLDPTHALVMPAGHAFAIRHPAGPDTCISFHGALIDRLAEDGPRIVAITTPQSARLAVELARDPEDCDELAIAELVASIAGPREPARADRDLVGAVTRALRLGFAESTSLAELAEHTGYSMFHTCRVFRATTGHTIHGFRRELRLRHALARILDPVCTEPLVEIAAQTGFSSQSHLTNLFRARFGVTPAKARTPEGMRRLSG